MRHQDLASRPLRMGILPLGAVLLASCAVVPVPPEGLPDDWIPSISPSPIDDVLDNNPLGFTPEEQSAVRIRNTSCNGLATGSGFIFDEHTIVTNAHVVEDFNTIEISTSDGEELTTASVQISLVSDFAIITTVEALTPLVSLANNDPHVLDPVTIVGYPGGDELTTSTGTVLNRQTDQLGSADHVFRVSATVEEGSSGSAAYNDEGQVFGLLYAGEEGTNDGIIIPISIVVESLAHSNPIAPNTSCS